MKLVTEKSALPRLLAFPLGALAVAGAIAFLLRGRELERLAFCPLLRFCGVPCPTCGGTHAALALARLDLAEALRLNPLVTLAGLGTAVWGGWAIAATLRPAWRRSLEVGPREARALRVAAAIALLGAWAYQIWRRAG